MKERILAVLAAMLLSSTAYAAPSVIFNGIDVTGASNQVFTNVTVEFDANGNVILTAPQYKLVDTTPKAVVPPSSAIPAQMGRMTDGKRDAECQQCKQLHGKLRMGRRRTRRNHGRGACCRSGVRRL